jgi:SlyX protein
MSDGRDVSERIDALESRVMYQDDTIETLNQTITAQWREIDALKRQIALLNERLEETRAAGAAGPVDETPPHY